MHFIEAKFVLHVKENEHTGSQSQCKPKNIDKGITLVLHQISESNLEIILNHVVEFLT
tara:strand:+ start:218888 stop:219061 length:174 start_codon:yes stop_codon:yes gene_type:complete